MEYDRYDVVEAKSLSELTARVNTSLQDGWECQGGVSAVVHIYPHSSVNLTTYLQAIVRNI